MFIVHGNFDLSAYKCYTATPNEILFKNQTLSYCGACFLEYSHTEPKNRYS